MVILRLTESAIDRANDLDDVPVMDEGAQTIVPAAHEIKFDKVDFSYGERPVLKSVSVTIPEKKMTAIVGPSGSEKTTLCNLIARFWDVDDGHICIGGRDVKIILWIVYWQTSARYFRMCISLMIRLRIILNLVSQMLLMRKLWRQQSGPAVMTLLRLYQMDIIP